MKKSGGAVSKETNFRLAKKVYASRRNTTKPYRTTWQKNKFQFQIPNKFQIQKFKPRPFWFSLWILELVLIWNLIFDAWNFCWRPS